MDELKIFEDKDGAAPCLGDVEGDVDVEVICDMLQFSWVRDAELYEGC